MIDKTGDIVLLLKKHINEELTESEKNELAGWVNESEENRKVFDELTHEATMQQAVIELYEFRKRHDDDQEVPVVGMNKYRTGWLKYAAAAAVIIAVGLVWKYALNNRDHQPVAVTNTATNSTTQDIAPGGNKAVLTLADGSTIILDNKNDGLIAEQDNTTINKKQDGELVYNNDPERSRRAQSSAPSESLSRTSVGIEGPTHFNTVTTPRGGQYQLTLPDGTKAWLNAASSLKFPVSFTGATRTVQLTGEAYFEVAHVTLSGSSVSMPFEVQVNNGMKVQVLGTHFNIMAYEEEKEAKTTLLQGKVKVIKENNSNSPASVLLQPGQQALLADANLRIQKDANVAEAIAWKEGKFKFVHTDLKAVMRNLARWYDVQVEYAPGIPEKYFTGEISRRLNASEVLSVIEFAGVHWHIEGKKIIVIP
jgi:transmembrane sensor